MPDPDTRANSTAVAISAGEFSGANLDYFRDNALTAGEALMPRDVASSAVTMSSGNLRLAYFTARKSEVVTTLRVTTNSTAAGATPTLVRYGLYTVAANGDITLVASTANDTTLFAAANTAYPKALSAAYTKRAGVRYAIGVLVVTGAAAPTIVGENYGGSGADWALAPRLSGIVGGQADLPASVVAASVADTTARPQAILLP